MRKILCERRLTLDGREVGLAGVLRLLVSADARFNRDGPGIRSGARVLAAADQAEAAGTPGRIVLESAEWERLSEASEKPMTLRADGSTVESYPVNPGVLLAPFVEAIRGATE